MTARSRVRRPVWQFGSAQRSHTERLALERDANRGKALLRRTEATTEAGNNLPATDPAVVCSIRLVLSTYPTEAMPAVELSLDAKRIGGQWSLAHTVLGRVPRLEMLVAGEDDKGCRYFPIGQAKTFKGVNVKREAAG